jgi:hypothetical protein
MQIISIVFDILISIVWLYILYNFAKTLFGFRKRKRELDAEFERQKKILEEYYFRLMAEQMRKSQQTQKHSKWYGLEQSVRDKIVKVKALAERGEGGEKEAAKLKYQKMLQKNNLHPADVPVNLV